MEGKTNIFKDTVEDMFEIPRKLKFLFALSEIKEPLTIYKIEKRLGFINSQPDFRKIASFLIDKGILKVHSKHYIYSRYIIDKKKFIKFFNNLKITMSFFEYFQKNHFCVMFE